MKIEILIITKNDQNDNINNDKLTWSTLLIYPNEIIDNYLNNHSIYHVPSNFFELWNEVPDSLCEKIQVFFY